MVRKFLKIDIIKEIQQFSHGKDLACTVYSKIRTSNLKHIRIRALYDDNGHSQANQKHRKRI